MVTVHNDYNFFEKPREVRVWNQAAMLPSLVIFAGRLSSFLIGRLTRPSSFTVFWHFNHFAAYSPGQKVKLRARQWKHNSPLCYLPAIETSSNISFNDQNWFWCTCTSRQVSRWIKSGTTTLSNTIQTMKYDTRQPSSPLRYCFFLSLLLH